MSAVERFIDRRIRLLPATEYQPKGGNIFLRYLGKLVLFFSGWRLDGKLPEERKILVIGAPHTSNWDFVIFVAIVFALGIKLSYLAKHTLFETPIGFFFRWFGGIPINQSASKGVVEQVVDVINQQEKILLVVAPEGTRSKVRKWRTGFYHIAQAANIPILLVTMDFPNKVFSLGDTFRPSGDMDVDLLKIQKYYKDRSFDIKVV